MKSQPSNVPPAPVLREQLAQLPDPLAFLEGLFAHSPVPYAVFGADGRCLLTNPAYRTMFGATPPPDYDLFRDELIARLGMLPVLQRVLAGETVQVPPFWYDPRELQHVHVSDAKRVAIACTFFPLGARGHGGVGHLAIAYQDVTAELEAKAAVEQERDLLRAIIAQSGEGILVADAEGVLRIVNPAAERQHGASAQEVAATDWRSTYRLLDLQDQPLALEQLPLYRAVFHGETVQQALWQVRRPDGALRTLEGTASPLRRADASPAGGVLLTRDVTERRRAEDELRLHSRILEDMAEGVSVTDEGGTITFTNAAADRMFGYPRGGMLGQPVIVQSAYPPEEHARRAREVTAALQARGEWSGEWDNRRRDGTLFTTRARITALSIDGRPHRVCVEQDVTLEVEARRRAELLAEELRQSEAHYRATVELSPQVPWTATPEGRNSGFSERWLQLTGMTREQALGEGWMDAQHPEDRPRMVEAWLHSVRTGEPYDIEHRVRLADGAYRWMRSRAFPARTPEGQVVRWYGTTEDIHDRVEAQAALEESERLLREWVENLPELAWSARADGHIDYYNRRWYEYTGTTPEQMEGWGWRSVHHPDTLPQVMARWQGAIASGEPTEMQFPMRGADGQYRWFLSRVRPLRDGQGRVLRWFGTNADIDAQQRQQAALREAVEARNTFLSIAGHELKTPLTPLSLKLQALERARSRRAGAPDAPVPVDPRDLDVMRRQVRRLGDLVSDLLDVSRISTGQLRLERRPTDLGALVREVVARFEPEAERAGCQLSLLAPAALPGQLDPLRLEQVVTNLLSNALKYGAGQPVHVQVEEAGGWARLQVKDRGIGIAAEAQGRIFGRFERAVSERHYGGFGLGLYVTREIVEGLGGRVQVQSAPGQGALFTVELPLAPPAP